MPPFPLLSAALEGTDAFAAAEAARLVGEWRLRDLIPSLEHHLRTSRSYSKVTAMYAWDALDSAGSADCLAELFERPNVPDDFYWVGYRGTRAAAAAVLLRMGNAVGLPWLRERAELRDEVITRTFAPYLLRLPASAGARDFLTLDLLCDRAARDAYDPTPYSEPGALCMLCEALGVIDDDGADDHLEFYSRFHSRFVRAQVYRSRVLRDPGPETIRKIRQTTQQNGTPFERITSAVLSKDTTILARMATEARTPFDRASAIDGLREIGQPGSWESASIGLADRDPQVRQRAVEAVAHLSPDDSAKALLELRIGEKNPLVLRSLEAATHHLTC